MPNESATLFVRSDAICYSSLAMSSPSHQRRTALTEVLLALVPYTRQNLVLAQRPRRFFSELEQASDYSQATLRAAYRRALIKGLIDPQGTSLTPIGLRSVQPFIAERLPGGKLIVIFDIPESHASDRRQLRLFLKHWGFNQIQKSVWATDRDHRDALLDIVGKLKIGSYVELYEGVRLFPKVIQNRSDRA
jgi:hypothetical protein